MRTAFTPLSESPRALHSSASSFFVQSSRGPSSSSFSSSAAGSAAAASSAAASSVTGSSAAASSTEASSAAASSTTGSSAIGSSATASSSTAASSSAASSTAVSVEAFASLILAIRTAFTPLSESPRVLHSSASSFLLQSSRGPSPSSIPESFSDSLSACSCFSTSAASSSFFFCSSIHALCLLGSDVTSSVVRVFLFRAGIVTAPGSRVRKRFLMYSIVTRMTLMRNQGVSRRVTSCGLK